GLDPRGSRRRRPPRCRAHRPRPDPARRRTTMSSPTTPHDPVDTAAAPEAALDRRGRITWSLIAEPSDAVALLACTVLGHTTALELAENGTSPDLLRALGGQLPSQAAEPGGMSPSTRAQRAMDRWQERRKVIDLDAVLVDA